MVNMVQVLLCSLDNPPILEISTNAASVADSWGFEKMVKCYLNSWEPIDPYINKCGRFYDILWDQQMWYLSTRIYIFTHYHLC
jgi:hypothetical protein